MEELEEEHGFEVREEFMIAPNGAAKPSKRLARFLKPCVNSVKGQVFEFPSDFLSSLPPTFEPKTWRLNVNFHGWRSPQKNWRTSTLELRSLNLSHNFFSGRIPENIGAMAILESLDFSYNRLEGEIPKTMVNMNFLAVFNISYSNGPLVTNALRSLLVLQLAGCQLSHFPPLSVANFSSLVTLDLSHNQFDNSLIATQLYGLCNLVFLDLSDNNFQGPIPDTIQNWTSLRHLDLSSNHFSYLIPEWLNKFSRLEYLSLSRHAAKIKLEENKEQAH